MGINQALWEVHSLWAGVEASRCWQQNPSQRQPFLDSVCKEMGLAGASPAMPLGLLDGLGQGQFSSTQATEEQVLR